MPGKDPSDKQPSSKYQVVIRQEAVPQSVRQEERARIISGPPTHQGILIAALSSASSATSNSFNTLRPFLTWSCRPVTSNMNTHLAPVSYTHLTLPTIYSV